MLFALGSAHSVVDYMHSLLVSAQCPYRPYLYVKEAYCSKAWVNNKMYVSQLSFFLRYSKFFLKISDGARAGPKTFQISI